MLSIWFFFSFLASTDIAANLTPILLFLHPALSPLTLARTNTHAGARARTVTLTLIFNHSLKLARARARALARVQNLWFILVSTDSAAMFDCSSPVSSLKSPSFSPTPWQLCKMT